MTSELSSMGGGDKELLAFPAALAQEAFYYLNQLDPQLTAFNVAVRFRLEGSLNPAVMERAFNTIVERHEILRTHFEEEDGGLIQVVTPLRQVSLPVNDISHFAPAARAAELERLGLIEAGRLFDLGVSPLFRCELIRLSAEEHILHVTLHHAICDGWSVGLLTDELTALYAAYIQGKPSPLAPLEIQYADFAVWQHEFLASPEMNRQMDYWKGRLHGLVEPDLPTDRPRPAVKRWQGDIVSALLPEGLTSSLEKLAQANQASLFHVFLAAFNVLLHRYTGAKDISIGTPMAGRGRAELDPVIGTFINTVILRAEFSAENDFTQILQQVRDRAVEAMAHQDLPFESLIRELRPERDPSRNPLFQVNFTHQRDFVKPVTIGDLKLTAMPSVSPGAIFDLHLFTVERDGVWRTSCDFNTDLFDRATALRLLGHFRKLLESIVKSPWLSIDCLPMMGEEEERQLLRYGNGKKQHLDANGGVGRLFAETAEKFADKVAVRCGPKSLTYAGLARRSRQISAALQAQGVQAGDRVGVCLERSIDMVAVLLGIFEAGAAYVPLDPALPAGRLGFMVEDAELQAVVTTSSLLEILPVGHARVLLLDRALDEAPANYSARQNGGEDVAYVTFTSGSTGRPKGVCVPHRALVNFLHSMGREPGLEAGDVLFSVTTLSFDISGLEIFLPLTTGATVVIAEGATLADGRLLRENLENSKACVMQATPATWRLLVEAGWAGHRMLKILIGGEAVPRELVTQLIPRCRSIWNVYGPTETTIWSAVARLETGDGAVPIGHPIENTQLYVVNGAWQLQPIGIPGELLIGGDGLALGYLNRPELTAEKFIPNPFEPSSSARLYRTGDLARWRADGSLECLGRFDHQLKIRGYRIEPGEIETLLEQHPLVTQAVVVASPDHQLLVAHIMAAQEEENFPETLRDYLREHLPVYMIPGSWVFSRQFPLTPNGKVDRLALSRIKISAPAMKSTPPVTATEKKLAEIWCDVLGLESVGREDSFFDLGGHSLLALRLFSHIQRRFGLFLPLATLLRFPTLIRMADLLDVEKANSGQSAVGIETTILAAVQPEGHLAPFFCVHGADGGVLFYRELAHHLTKDRPLLAIEAPALSAGEEVRDETIESVAARYVDSLLRYRPDGPFLLGGYSFGGVVAYEMACQLTAAGKQVEFLALFDTLNPVFQTFSRMDRILRIWNQDKGLGFLGRSLKLAAYIIGRIGSRLFGRFIEAKNGRPELPNDELYAAHIRAMEAYHPRPYAGRLTLFRADEKIRHFQLPEDYGWGALVTELDMIFVPGQHSTLFDTENVLLLGTKLRQSLQSVSV